ncbi:hypothetical protein BANRA_02610 [Acinetobacter baumannii]|nr:hypothetical protein BANRA_02610 [Acinetobacter baumannii]
MKIQELMGSLKEIVYPNGIISQHDIILDDRNDNIPEIVLLLAILMVGMV